jgi:hypothetical protein
MGWTDSHLHLFRVDGVQYGEPDPEYLGELKNEKRARLSQLVTAEKQKFIYEYDFGDDWTHEILLEKILPQAPGEKYPVCIAGKRECPPEDCGGVWGYAEFLEAIRDPGNPEHESMLEWIGGSFNPESFAIEVANARLSGRS